MPRLWIHAALLLPVSALTAAAVLAWQTPDLHEVQTERNAKSTQVHDLASMLQQTAIKQSATMELDEGELNDHLARRLFAKQGGASGRFASFEAVLLDIEDNRCRVNFCWRVFGHRVVGSADIAVRRTKQDFTIEVVQGAYGRLQVPRALLPPLLPALKELTKACRPEIDALFKLPHIQFAKDKVLVDSKF